MVPDKNSIADYLTITGGVLGRLVISVLYFLIVANVLPVGEFGVFAASAAVGLILSRLVAFGFISPVYRTATVRPRVLGAYLGGLLAFGALSLPLVFAAAAAVHAVFFDARIALTPFLVIIAAEVVGVRTMEFAAITLNGLSRFGQAARLVVIASAIRSGAALLFWFAATPSLASWIWWNLASATLGAFVALAFYMPRPRLRLAWRLYPRRTRDALTAAASDLAFYAQAELDKVVVLAVAGDRAAGVYAIAMRLIDLTAIPVRGFNQMLVQKMMREREGSAGLGRSATIEAAVATVSILGLLGFVALLWPRPDLLGQNVAKAAPVLLPMLLIPALRNLVELHGELLYAREFVVTRLSLLCGLTAMKLGLMALLISGRGEVQDWALPLTGVFAVVYAASAAVTYGRLGVRWR